VRRPVELAEHPNRGLVRKKPIKKHIQIACAIAVITSSINKAGLNTSSRATASGMAVIFDLSLLAPKE
jgi:hypothetical protein